ncbi:MAG: YibE/F family protein [Lentisphaeria bacterium]|nr:YibE/F family protein [Lentisphaerota bacterium]MBR7144869.1 YibE/F family protein [Lentisphaeria bacterium]
MNKLFIRLKKHLSANRNELIMSLVMIAFSLLLVFFEPLAKKPSLGTKEKARVISTDNSEVVRNGFLCYGSQVLQIEVLSGKYAGKHFRAANELRMQMDLDKLFEPGDTVLVGIMHDADPERDTVNAQDHYRIDWAIVLFLLFALLLMIFGNWTGFNALLSFVFSCLVVWKAVIPLCLAGANALLITFLAVMVLSVVIIILIGGFTRKGFTALAGSLLGVLASCITGWIFTHLFKINGAVMPYSQTLLNSGYPNLNLSEIFIGAIFLSSSGAVMDLAMDVASGIEEIDRRRGGLSAKELFQSGIRIGRSVVGTMTTTLLLAYSGGYLTLMMTFAAQGTSPVDFINNPYVASEAVKTLVGSFGLVLVAPFTAAVGALIFGRNK